MIVKGVPIDGYLIVKLEDKPHLFLTSKGGGILHIDIEKRISRTINALFVNNQYLNVTYSHTAKKIYFFSDQNIQMVQYDYKSGMVKHHNLQKYFQPYSNVLVQNTFSLTGKLVNPVSTDGNLYLGSNRYRAVPSIMKFNTLTESVDGFGTADIEFEHIHGKQYAQAYKFVHGTFGGIYSSYVYTDTYNELVTQIKSECVTSGVTLTYNQVFYLHYSDRAIGSTTRRIFAPVNGTWKCIDVKSPSTNINSQVVTTSTASTAFSGVWLDGVTTISKSGWSSGLLGTYATELGISNPVFDPILAYNGANNIGRFAYQINKYMAGKTIFYTFAYHPTTFEALYPDTFDKSTTFQNNGLYTHYYRVCNFAGNYGFSSSNEYVLFVPNNVGTPGFFRPDTNTWMAYNPITDPSGYVIRSFNPDTEFNWNIDYFYTVSDLDISGDVFKTRSGINCGIRITGQQLDTSKRVGKLTVEIIPDLNNTDNRFSLSSKYMAAVPGTLMSGFELDSNRLLFGGIRYAGISASILSGADIVERKYFGDVSSLYFGLRVSGTKGYFGGYLGTQHFIDYSDINNPIQINVNTNGSSKDAIRASLHNNHIVQVGQEVRQAAYFNTYFYAALINHSTYAVSGIPNKPNPLNPAVAQTFRTSLGLTQNTYSDAAVEAAFNSWITTNGYTRTTGINLLLDSAKWFSNDVVNFSDTSVFSLQYKGISAFRGIRINEFANGSGTWYDENTNRTTKYPACLLITKSDLTTIVQSDYKLVEFQISGLQGKDKLGRVASSTDYICFPDNDITNGIYRINVISKTSLLSAASSGTPITAWDRTINVSVGSTTDTSLGISGGIAFGTRHEFQDVYFTVGNDFYVSVNLFNSDICVQKINLATGAVSNIAQHSSDLEKLISYNSTSNRMLVCIGTDAYKVDNLTSISSPVTIS